jgi:hypothetical protein
MRQALWILRKDIRRMRPRIAVVWLLMAAAAVLDSAAGRHPQLANMRGFLLLVVLAQWFLVISVVHEDRLPGDRQFWITRPYSWKSLLLAKGLFVVLFVSLPTLLDHVLALAVNGFSPLHYLSALLWEEAGLAVGMLFVLALAALTANMVQIVLVALGYYLVLILGTAFAMRARAPVVLALGSAQPVETVFNWAIAALFAGLACRRQFSKRDTWRASVLFVFGLLLLLPFNAIVPWDTAFHLMATRLPAVDSTAVRLESDPGHKVGAGATHPEEGRIAIALPIRVIGIPDGMEVYSERVKIALHAADGADWNSALDPYNVIQDRALEPEAVYRRLPGKGEPYWLTANIDKSFCHYHGDEPVHVHATVAFIMLGRAQTTAVSRWGEPQAIAGEGICELSKREATVGALCISPLRKPALTVIRFEPLPSGYPNGLVSLDHPPAGSSDLGGFGIWRVVQSGIMTAPPEPFAMSIEVRQAVAHFERELDMSGIRLKEYQEP